ncbi:hypothetical protein [Streptococcus parauberis]|uniref:hypothetical protein n=1 Tax=Streptococcus parauberis TaxID=1348 RepID=UPI0002FB505F|nr:hypothetical protein [Streptococcus parauberis]QBX17953.1 hypothetical protein Javan385_0050 [Streptococcus phage Javan385]UWM91895.1 hypothetical protein N2A94_04480 [Streptococcus parauberis]
MADIKRANDFSELSLNFLKEVIDAADKKDPETIKAVSELIKTVNSFILTY